MLISYSTDQHHEKRVKIIPLISNCLICYKELS